MNTQPKKKPYEPAKVVDAGSLRELTLATGIGPRIDADFPDGTPASELTFS